MHRRILSFNGSSNPIVLHQFWAHHQPLQPGVAFESFQELRISYLSWLTLVSGEIHAGMFLKRELQMSVTDV